MKLQFVRLLLVTVQRNHKIQLLALYTVHKYSTSHRLSIPFNGRKRLFHTTLGQAAGLGVQVLVAISDNMLASFPYIEYPSAK
jgi:hypothetical protein